MKKIAFLLALLTVTSLCLASCNSGDGESTTTAATTTTASTTTRTPPPVITPDTNEEENKAPDLADGSKFVLDGNLSEWADLHKIELIGQKVTDANNVVHDYSNKKATFYGVLTDQGLYLACDAYHDIYIGNSDSEWWTNSNFEFFIGIGNVQKYVYARGMENECATSSADVTGKMVTEALIGGPTAYHTITEVFVPTDYLNESDILANTIDVGVAWKTLEDVIIGGGATVGPNGEDEYWVPAGTWPSGSNKPIVAPTGIYLPGEYEF